MTNRLSRELTIALGALALLALALVGYLLLISPQRSEAARLEDEIQQTRQQLETRRAPRPVEQPNAIRPADVRRVAKAMPDRLPIAGIVLELNRVAGVSGLGFESIAPQAPVPLRGYQAVPLNVIVQGRFFDVREFIARVRNRAGVRDGRIDARGGRLFAIETVDLAEGEDGFPQVRATLRINAFTFAGGAPAGAGAATGATTTTGGTP